MLFFGILDSIQYILNGNRNLALVVSVTLNGEAMIKLVYYKGEDWQLTSANQAYPDRFIAREDVPHLHPMVHIRLAKKSRIATLQL